MVYVTAGLELPEAELAFATSRSSGPGGQNVNKVSTRVTLLWNVDVSPSISDKQRALVRERLAGRISREGVLRVSSQRHRTQLGNREAAVARFAELLAEALSEAPRRIPLRVPASVERKRLETKRRRSRLKQARSDDFELDD
jgi:ribosome-associated protein